MTTPDQLAEQAMARLRRDVNDLEAWSLLFMLFARARDTANLDGLLQARQSMLGDALGFFYYVMRDLVSLGQDAIAAGLARRLPPGHPLYGVGLYMQGLVACRAGRSDEAIALIRAAASAVSTAEVLAFAARDTLFHGKADQQIAAQAGFLEPAAWILALETEPVRRPPIDFRTSPGAPGEAILVAACDSGYFTRFAPALCQSVAEVSGNGQTLHLHLVAPSPSALALIDALTARHGFLRVSTEPDARTATYYASSRFLVAPALLDRYRRPLITIDIDVTLQQPPAAIVTALKQADIALLKSPERLPVPSLVCDARLVAIADTPASRRFLDLLARYLDRMFARDARWMVDQAALYCVICALGPALKCFDLGRLPGAPYGGMLVPADATADKTALRKEAQ